MGNTGFIEGEETLEYQVSFEASEFFNKEYFTVAYCVEENANYTTSLKASTEPDCYEYTTNLSIGVQYTLANGEKSEVFEDSVSTTTIFKSTALALQPVRSEKTVKSHTPLNTTATTLQDAYTNFDYTVSIAYAEDGTSGEITYTDRQGTLFGAKELPAEKKESFDINTEKYTYLDNEQLLLAIRGLSSTVLATERTISTYDVATKAQQNVKIKPDSATSDKFSFAINGEQLPVDTVIEYIPVSLQFIAINEGSPIQAWYAKTTDPANNTYRNVMLKMQTTVSYNIGVLTYTLKSANFAK